jgi:LysM repeat protein
MQALRQLGGGVIIAIVSVVLVLGGIFLSLAETLPDQATPTQIPPTLPLSFPTPTFTQTPGQQTATSTVTETASPSPTISIVSPTACTPPPGWIRILSTAGDTVYSLAQRYKTSAEHLNAANCFTSSELAAGSAVYVPPVPTVTIVPCGPPAGWVRAHIVQAGDNLYRIALSYGLTYPQLQRPNCMGSSTTIYAGQRLWVPNIPTRTPVPGVTIIPDFPTETPSATNTTIPATSTNTATEPPPTATATSTSIPTATFTITTFPPEDSPQ